MYNRSWWLTDNPYSDEEFNSVIRIILHTVLHFGIEVNEEASSWQVDTKFSPTTL